MLIMNIYIAAHSQSTAKELKHRLESTGHRVVARWIEYDTKFGQGAIAYTDGERRALAIMDEEDVRRADALVLLAELQGQLVPGGKHVETGIALGIGIPVYVVGRRENIFHWHPRVKILESIDSLLKSLDPRFQCAIASGAVVVKNSINSAKDEAE